MKKRLWMIATAAIVLGGILFSSDIFLWMTKWVFGRPFVP